VWFFHRATKAHSQEWLCYEEQSLVDFFRNLFSLPEILSLTKIKSQTLKSVPPKSRLVSVEGFE
jgi:hypothetical protein